MSHNHQQSPAIKPDSATGLEKWPQLSPERSQTQCWQIGPVMPQALILTLGVLYRG